MGEFTASGTARADIGTIELAGQLDGDADTALGVAWDDAVERGATVVVVDFSRIDYINSTGIALVVGLLGRARAASSELRVCGLTEHYRHIFEITRLADLMTIYDTSEEALGGVVAPG